MTTCLFFQYYKPLDSWRAWEISKAIQKNAKTSASTFAFSGSPLDHSVLYCAGVTNCIKGPSTRLSFADWLAATSIYVEEGSVSILCNSDIFFTNSSIARIESCLGYNQVVCLSRKEVSLKGKICEAPHMMQDAWAIRKHSSSFDGALVADLRSILIGTPGCDNRAAALFYRNGYDIINPSLEIDAFHLHLESQRGYSESDAICGEYAFIAATRVAGYAESYLPPVMVRASMIFADGSPRRVLRPV